MLQVSYIRQHKDDALKRLAIKNIDAAKIIDIILQTDDERKKLQFEKDETQAKINAASKSIKELMMSGKKDEAEVQKRSVADFKTQLAELSEKLINAEKSLHDHLVQLPNLPHESVPKGKSATDNITVKEGGRSIQLPENALAHWDLAKKYDLIDFELGNKVTGSGFPFYKGDGAKLQRALIQYFLDYNSKAGYTEYEPPLMVNEASAYGTGQLPDKEGQMYFVTADNFYLIPTSEVPLTNIYRNDILRQESLPLKMTSYTPCFRREAGSYGKDVRGLNRLHQFDKVEIVQLVHPSKSYAVLEEMVQHVETLIQSLELPYRILKLCGGDMSFASALTYDFEVFSAAQQKWLEVSSVSNFENFQTNRMKIRFKDDEGKTQLVHSLNGSSLALPRIVAALLENHQAENGINIPVPLQNYFGKNKIG